MKSLSAGRFPGRGVSSGLSTALPLCTSLLRHLMTYVSKKEEIVLIFRAGKSDETKHNRVHQSVLLEPVAAEISLKDCNRPESGRVNHSCWIRGATSIVDRYRLSDYERTAL